MPCPSILSPPEIARCEASHGCIWSCAAAGGTPQLALQEKGSKTGRRGFADSREGADRMRSWERASIIGAVLIAVGSPMLLTESAGQTPAKPPAYRAPRSADGKADLSGLWQAINTAAWNLQDHSAQFGIPAGQGVVEGHEIPYQPWAAAKKQEN